MCQYCHVLLELWAVVCNLHVNVMDIAVHIFIMWYIYIIIIVIIYRLHLLIFYQILLNVGGMHLYWMFCFATDWAFGSVFRYVNALKWGSTSGLASGKSCILSLSLNGMKIISTRYLQIWKQVSLWILLQVILPLCSHVELTPAVQT